MKKHFIYSLLAIILTFTFSSCEKENPQEQAQDTYVQDNYTKQEVDININVSGKDTLISKGFTTVPQVFSQEGNYLGDCTSIINTYG